MLEDDIQYLGSRSTNRADPGSSARPFRPVTGITLHVERSGDQAPCHMHFPRSDFNGVDIGRRPGATSLDKRHEPTECGRAMFRCPVISRRHAKITFGENGQVYLTDLNSHHGTHILKPDESVSRTIKPEIPTILADGDVVTFGKTVGKDSNIVSPIVVRIGLLYDPPIERTVSLPRIIIPNNNNTITPKPTLLQLFSGNTPPWNNNASTSALGDFMRSESQKKATSSGRYGLYVPSSHGSDISSPDMDSDIEELDGPPSITHSPSHSSSSSSNGLPSPDKQTNAPPTRCSIAGSPSSTHGSDPSPSTFTTFNYRFPRLPSPSYSSMGFEDVYVVSSGPKSMSPMDLSSPSPEASICIPAGSAHNNVFEFTPSPSPVLPESVPVGPEKDKVIEISPSPSRAVSICATAGSGKDKVVDFSPSPPPLVSDECGLAGSVNHDLLEPSLPSSSAVDWKGKKVIEFSPTPSPSPSPDVIASVPLQPCPEAVHVEVAEARKDVVPLASAESSPVATAGSIPECYSPYPQLAAEYDYTKKAEPQAGSHDSASALHKPAENRYEQIDRALNAYFPSEVQSVSPPSSDVHIREEVFTDLDNRLHDVYSLCLSLEDQIESVADEDVPDLHSAIEYLQDQIDKITPPISGDTSVVPIERLVEQEDVKANINALNALVNEMQALRDNTERQMAHELAAVRVARGSAITTIANSSTQVASVARLVANAARTAAITQTRPPPDISDGGEPANVSMLLEKGADVNAQTNQTGPPPPLTSLKRKRSSDDDGDDDAPVRTRSVFRDVFREESGEEIMAIRRMNRIGVRSCKRGKRIVSTLLKAATAVTIGAVATWSALAFS